jgi:hypothetical protein
MKISVSVLGFLISICYVGASARAYDSSASQNGIRWIENMSQVGEEGQGSSVEKDENESDFDFQGLTSDCGTTIRCGRNVYSCCPGDHYTINNCNGYKVRCN